MTRVRRAHLLLGMAALTSLVAALAVSVMLAASRVRFAERDLLRSEAKIAVALLRETDDTTALRVLFGDRWSVSAAVDPLLDEPVIEQGPVVRAALYDADSWFQIGTLRLAPHPAATVGLPPAVWLTALAAAVLLLLVVLTWTWFTTSANRAQRRLARALLLLATGASLAASLWETGSWAVGRLEYATARRIAAAANALELVPDLGAVIRRPGGIAQLSGLSHLVIGPAGEVLTTTLPSGATSELAAIVEPYTGRTTADHVEYAVTDVPPVRLVALPYDHGGAPAPALVAIGLIGLMVAMFWLALGGLAARPRILRRDLVAWSFLAPSLVHLAVFTVAPLALAAWLSLHRWSLIDAARPFVGLANYVRLLSDGAFWNAIRNTAVFTLHVPVAMAVALGLALIVHRRVRGMVFLRATLFLPTITSLVAIAMVWQWMLHDEYGLINWLLVSLGFSPVHWLSSPSTALISLMIMAVWMVVGYQMILFQAGLATIPQELYDAARIDGARTWQRFVHVTLPGLRHTSFFVLVTSVIGSFQVFGAVYVMTEGGPLRSTDVVVFHIYQEAWEFFRFGDAAAMSWVLFAIIFLVTWLQFRFLERRVEERT